MTFVGNSSASVYQRVQKIKKNTEDSGASEILRLPPHYICFVAYFYVNILLKSL